MKRTVVCAALLLVLGGAAFAGPDDSKKPVRSEPPKVVKTDVEWRKTLTPEQYRVLRQKDTEAPFTGKYWETTEKGIYACAGCGQELFRSDTKFEAGCGWPSFWQAIDKTRIELRPDDSHGMHRIEVLCKRCGGHLGHVFDDGPKPTGKRFCINSASLVFRKPQPAKSNTGQGAASR